MKKQKLPNISKVGSKIDESLGEFITNKEEDRKETFNPIKDKKKRAKKQPSEKQDTKKESSEKKRQVSENKEHKIDNKSYKREDLPNDFKSHSALFSEEQLNKLRKVVNYKKWKVDPKYTIQLAIFEAIEMLFDNREKVEIFPEDFITYSPSFSIEQRENLERFVAEVRFKENERYALKYAIFEAIEMFLNRNPNFND